MEGVDADLTNTGNGTAGTVTAAAFLSEFVGDTEWAHIDIAAVARQMQDVPYLKAKTATGFGARLLIRWVLNEAE